MPLNLDKVSKELTTCRTPTKGDNVITPICRLSFPHLFIAVANKDSDPNDKRFSASFLIPPQFDLTLLKQDATRAAKEKFGDKIPSSFKSPFKDAGEYEYEGYNKGWKLLRATATSRPTILIQKGKELVKLTEDDGSEVYPGRWCIATLRAFGYDKKGGKGVAMGLNNILLLDHDEPLGGRMRAEDEFEAIGDYENANVAAGSIESLF